jgi:hypothetical protein
VSSALQVRQEALPPLDIDTTFEQWAERIKLLALAREVLKWELGDSIEWGSARWGEKYFQAIECTGLSYESLRNITYTCRNVPKEVRRDDLSFSHHTLVAPYAGQQETQRELLEWAAEQRASVELMRAHVRETMQIRLPSPAPLLRLHGEIGGGRIEYTGPQISWQFEEERERWIEERVREFRTWLQERTPS